MSELIKTIAAGNFWLGIGTAIAVSVLSPTIGKTAKPLAAKGVKGMMYLGDKTGELLKTGKEHIQTMVMSEVHEPPKNTPQHGDMRDMMDELKAQNRIAAEEINRLCHEIGALKHQLEQLKPM